MSGTSWAVYADYNVERMEYTVLHIMPWEERYFYRPYLKVEDAVDELGAYVKFMEYTRGGNVRLRTHPKVRAL